MKKLLAAVFAMILATSLLATDISSDFSAANKLYAQGKFAEAAQAYETILQSGTLSSQLLFNTGNAEFKSGHLGKAIAAYQRAAQLSPRDAELRANLAFVRNQVQGATPPENRWLGIMTLNEWTLLFTALFWLTLLLLAARQLRPALAPRIIGVNRICLGLMIISATGLAVQANNHFSKADAVVIVDNVTARSGPFEDAQSAFTARDGAELSVIGQRDGWVQVADKTGKTGWLQAKHVEVLPGA
jgi:tetratricopeptide (TPR) repeat protein